MFPNEKSTDEKCAIEWRISILNNFLMKFPIVKPSLNHPDTPPKDNVSYANLSNSSKRKMLEDPSMEKQFGTERNFISDPERLASVA